MQCVLYRYRAKLTFTNNTPKDCQGCAVLYDSGIKDHYFKKYVVNTKVFPEGWAVIVSRLTLLL